MADNVTFTSTNPAGPPDATVQRTDDLGAAGHVPYVKLIDGTDGGTTVIASGGGVEAGALRVTVASDSTGVLSVDDNGSTISVDDGAGSLTVDGTVSISGTVTVGSHAVTNAGTFAVQVDGAALTALQLIDNLVLAEDAVHGSGDPGVQLLAVRKDTAAALAGADGDYAPLEVDANGCLHVLVNGTVTVGSHAVTNAGTFAVQAAQSGTWNITNVSGTVSLPTGASTAAKQPALGTAGTASSDVITVQGIASMTALKVDGSAVTQPVSAASLPLPTGASTLAEQQTQTTHQAVMAGWDNAASDGASVSGDVAHDTADAGEPVKIGAKAVGTLSTQTLVAANDRSNVFSDLDGALIVRPYCALGDLSSGVAAISDGSSTSVIASPGAGLKTYVTSVIIANSSASNVTVDIRDGAAGAVKATFPAPATGGALHNLPVPLAFTADTAVCADPSAAASTVTVTLVGFKSKV